MLVFLDSVVIIYLVEGPAPFQAKARAKLIALRLAGHQMAFSDLTRLECRVKPMRLGDVALLADYDLFLNAGDMIKVTLTTAIYERATQIRADYNFKLGDSLHLAAAAESGCGAFLTNDVQLARFPDLTVEILQ